MSAVAAGLARRPWTLRHGFVAQYEATFHDNAIDAEVLIELTEADLEQRGALLGADRKKLVKAHDDLPAAPFGASRAPRANRAKRRQFTVMFCDLVGSTVLALQL
jgi:class 3 adenylate cyclase